VKEENQHHFPEGREKKRNTEKEKKEKMYLNAGQRGGVRLREINHGNGPETET